VRGGAPVRSLALAIVFSVAAGQAAAVPSGQPLALWQIAWERMQDAQGLQLVIRAIAPEVGELGFEAAQADMDWICMTHGLTLSGLPHGAAAQVVVNLMDTPIPRGTSNPDVAQFFSVYKLADGACILEDL
jgi:hypothetical protein